MSKLLISLEEVDPYIRLPHLFEVPEHEPLPARAAYDHRVMYIYAGAGTVIISGVKYPADKGNLFLWKSGIPYELIPDEGGMTIFGVNFDFTHSGRSVNYPIPPDDVGQFNWDNVIETMEFSDFEPFNGTVYLRSMQYVEQTLLEMEKEYMLRKRFFTHKIRGLFLLLLADISRRAVFTGTEQDDTAHKVDLILQYIREHYDQPLTNQQIGEHFNFHPVYINRLLVKYVGIPLHQYLIHCRISRAISLMQHSGVTVAEAAFQSGFKDVNYFSKCFKKRVGLSPKHYLEAARHTGMLPFSANMQLTEEP